MRASHRGRAGQVLGRFGRRRPRRRGAGEMRNRARGRIRRARRPGGLCGPEGGPGGFWDRNRRWPGGGQASGAARRRSRGCGDRRRRRIGADLRGDCGRAHGRARQQGDAGVRRRRGDGGRAPRRLDALADGLRAQRAIPGDRGARSGHDRDDDHHRVRRAVPRMERRADLGRDARGSARSSQLGDGPESDDRFGGADEQGTRTDRSPSSFRRARRTGSTSSSIRNRSSMA